MKRSLCNFATWAALATASAWSIYAATSCSGRNAQRQAENAKPLDRPLRPGARLGPSAAEILRRHGEPADVIDQPEDAAK